jgi:Thiol:disulfide interchange protein DsbD, N-terminal
MKAFVSSLVALAAFGGAAAAEAPKPVQKVEARFEPAAARPGEVVTLKIDVTLDAGWHTYPTVQKEKAARSYVNKITFPTEGPIIFVGSVIDPPDAKSKAEADIEELIYYPGGGTWERKAVVSPKATAGENTVKVKFRLSVCDKNVCLPPETLELEPKLKVSGAPVAVDSKYKDEVEKALGGK